MWHVFLPLCRIIVIAFCRARIVIQFANAHGITTQISPFRADVIDKSRKRYGVQANHWAAENCIDSILCADLEHVIIEVMDGLRVNKLVSHAKVICGEPSTKDWQVDTDRIIWQGQ